MVIQMAFILLFYLALSESAEILRDCDNDIDCGSGYYCFLSYCERCIPCDAHFNRQPPRSLSGHPICARYEDDCGICLPGYRANDLTDQRRSMECFPSNETVLTATDFPWAGIVWIASVLFLTILFITCFVKCRRVQSVSNIKDPEWRPSAPPPYSVQDPGLPDETDGLMTPECVRTSERIVIQETETLCNEAIPFDYYDIFNNRVQDSDGEAEEIIPVTVNVVVDLEIDDESNQSTETIPSAWEPTPSILDISRGFIRSQSMESLPRAASTSQLVRLASDPEILSNGRRASYAGESYSHLHIRLSQYRSESQAINQAESSKSVEDCNSEDDLRRRVSFSMDQDDQEPEAPESFLADEDSVLPSAIQDTTWFRQTRARQDVIRLHESILSEPSSGQGSQDSGFQDQSRRRSRTAENSLEVNHVPIGAKKRRRNCSENE